MAVTNDDIPVEVKRAVGSLELANRSGDEYLFPCPACESTDNLSVRYRGNGERPIVKCWSGCHEDWPKLSKALRAHGAVLYGDDTAYVFRNEAGVPVYRQTIIRKSDGSKITPLGRFLKFDSRTGMAAFASGTGNMKGVQRVFYNLPELLERIDEPIWFHEGPKKADISMEHGLLSTAIAGGATGTWPVDLAIFSGRRINFCLDLDLAGLRFVKKARELLIATVAEFHLYRSKYGKDAWDHFHSGGEADEFIELTFDEADELLAAEVAESRFIDCSNDKETVLALERAVNLGWFPDIYQRNDELVQLRADASRSILLTAPAFQLSAAEHLDLQRNNTKGVSVPAFPHKVLFSAAMTGGVKDGWLVPELRRVVSSPVIRSDGTILQQIGYDIQTQQYLRQHFVSEIPLTPDREQIAEAKRFIFSELLADFPWRSASDRANYVAMLFTPVLYDYIGGLVPLFVMDAPMAASGKTLLADILAVQYGGDSFAWAEKDEEMEKRITTILRGTDSRVIVFDNVGARDKLYQPSFAKLLTGRSWNGRLLGTSQTVRAVNDRVWIVTGRNIRVDGDMSSRMVSTRIEPTGPDPDKRHNFVIGDLFEWLSDSDNVDHLRYELLVLARGWLSSGAPLGENSMRQFSRWSKIAAGLLGWLDIDGFLTAEEPELSEEDQQLYAFYAKWDSLKGAPESATCAELVGRAMKFGDAFPIDTTSYKDPVKGLSKLLQRNRGKWIGEFQIASTGPSRTSLSWKLNRRDSRIG